VAAARRRWTLAPRSARIEWYYGGGERDARAPAGARRRRAGRPDNVRRERDSLQASSEGFRTLVDRGVLQGENRLDLAGEQRCARATS
jgi:hypothetical protein